MITVNRMINVSSSLNTLRKFVALEFRRYKLKFETSWVWKAQTLPSRCSNGLVQEDCNNGLTKGNQSTTLILSCSETHFQRHDSHLCKNWLLRGRLNHRALTNIAPSFPCNTVSLNYTRMRGMGQRKEGECMRLLSPALLPQGGNVMYL